MRKQPAFRTETCSEGCLQHLLQLIIHELHLGADDDLAGGLVGADDTGSTGSLHSLFIHSGVVLNGEAQAGSAVVHAGDVLLAADGLQHTSSNLSVVVVGQNDLLLSLFIVILTAGIIDSVFTFLRFEFLFKTVLVTFLLLLFGEILPKVLAQTIPLRFASMVARPLLVLRWVFYPLSYALVRTSSRISEKAAHKSEISLDELADAVDMTQSSSPEEHVMLSGIVNFVNTEVQEIMKPRVDITAVAITDSYEQVKQTIIRSGFSRIPVYEGDLDNIKGTLYVKDLLPYINHGSEFGWQQLVRKPYFVPEHKKINDLLADFQSNKVHMAIVVDEDVTYEQLVQRITSAGGKLLADVRLFDVYRDRVRVGEGKKSMAFALTYRSDDHTLTSEEVEKAHQKIVTKVCKGVNGEVRG